MKIVKNIKGAMATKGILALVIGLVVVLAYLSGVLQFALPSVADKYSQTVNRSAIDIGMNVPIEIKLTFNQDANTGANKAVVDANIKHKHEALGSDGNYVPDAKLVNSVGFDTEVGNVGDTKTVWSTNGNTFQASNVSYNSSLISVSSVQFGNSQDNYKVWTSHQTYSPGLAKDNCALLVQTVWKHYRRATNELLSADTVSWIIYYSMPTYNTDESYTDTFTYYVYVPFNDYAGDPRNSALVEDISVDIRGYFEHCVIEWTTVSVVTHEYWNFPLLNKFFPNAASSISLVRSRDVSLATAIQYSWIGPTDFDLDNDDQYGSHTYQYKIR